MYRYETHAAQGHRTDKSVASRWFNLRGIVASTEGDLWIHREKDELWWTRSSSGDVQISMEPAPWNSPEGALIYIVSKPADQWRNSDGSGAHLSWTGIHAKAREFLFTEGTLQQLSADNAAYAVAVLAARDLLPWHTRPDWVDRAAMTGHGAVRTLDAKARAIARMARTVADTVRASKGLPTLKTPKRKELRFGTEEELRAYISALIDAQEGLCAITDLPLQFDGAHEDAQMLCSLDRIDSDGHYERGNLQLVCRFVNAWKGDWEDSEFRRLMSLVRRS